MEKPFNLIIIETKQNLIKVLNESNLPITVLTMIANELLQTLNAQTNQQLEKEKQDYEKEIKNNPVIKKGLVGK